MSPRATLTTDAYDDPNGLRPLLAAHSARVATTAFEEVRRLRAALATQKEQANQANARADAERRRVAALEDQLRQSSRATAKTRGALGDGGVDPGDIHPELLNEGALGNGGVEGIVGSLLAVQEPPSRELAAPASDWTAAARAVGSSGTADAASVGAVVPPASRVVDESKQPLDTTKKQPPDTTKQQLPETGAAETVAPAPARVSEVVRAAQAMQLVGAIRQSCPALRGMVVRDLRETGAPSAATAARSEATPETVVGAAAETLMFTLNAIAMVPGLASLALCFNDTPPPLLEDGRTLLMHAVSSGNLSLARALHAPRGDRTKRPPAC